MTALQPLPSPLVLVNSTGRRNAINDHGKVFEPGALLFIGDGHVRQGEGEVLGNALEISMDVEFSVDLIKDRQIAWPRIETEDAIIVLR